MLRRWLPYVGLVLVCGAGSVALFAQGAPATTDPAGLSAVTSRISRDDVVKLTQSLVRVRMRAVASAILLFVINLIGLGLGPQTVGMLNDLLHPRFGPSAVRYSLGAVVLVTSLWASVHFALGARTLRADLEAKGA